MKLLIAVVAAVVVVIVASPGRGDAQLDVRNICEGVDGLIWQTTSEVCDSWMDARTLGQDEVPIGSPAQMSYIQCTTLKG